MNEDRSTLIVDYAIDEAQFARLRQLRLWHWRKAMEMRKLLTRQQKTLSPEVIKGRNATIYTHIGFVQTLNAFFEIGDTAERDSAS